MNNITNSTCKSEYSLLFAKVPFGQAWQEVLLLTALTPKSPKFHSKSAGFHILLIKNIISIIIDLMDMHLKLRENHRQHSDKVTLF